MRLNEMVRLDELVLSDGSVEWSILVVSDSFSLKMSNPDHRMAMISQTPNRKIIVL